LFLGHAPAFMEEERKEIAREIYVFFAERR